MKYSIVFSSPTGNTAILAETLKAALPQNECVYFGSPNVKALAAPMIFVGFWTDKGCCDESTQSFLKTIKNKSIFLFGTAGFGGSPEYFETILSNSKSQLDDSIHIKGTFMCTGKMPASVLQRYEKMLLTADDPTKINNMINDYHSALTHPDCEDLKVLESQAIKVLETSSL